MKGKWIGFIAMACITACIGGFAACGEDEGQSSLEGSSVSVEESSSVSSVEESSSEKIESSPISIENSSVEESSSEEGSSSEDNAGEEHVHIWGNWFNNGAAHWKECYCGERTGGGAHTESGWIVDRNSTCTATGAKHTECTVCGVEMSTGVVEKIAHSYVNEWKLGKDTHYKACVCGDRIEEGWHTFTGKQPCSVCQTPYYTMGLKYGYDYYNAVDFFAVVMGIGTMTDTDIVIPAVYDEKAVASIGENAFSDCSSLTIYCEVESEPLSWHLDWNYSNCPVVWGYKGENIA